MGRANSLETLALTFGDDDCDLGKMRGEKGGGQYGSRRENKECRGMDCGNRTETAMDKFSWS